MEEIRTDNTETLKNALKRIAELEQEKCELLGLIQAKDKVIKDLEKENAKLKKQQFSLRNERNTFLAQNEQYEKDLIDLNGNLTKAKEILKDILLMAKVEHLEDRYESVTDAKQFLEEIKMKVNEVIAIRTSSGIVKAGIKSFIRLFEKRTDLKETLSISDEDIKALTVTKELMENIYSDVDKVKCQDEASE